MAIINEYGAISIIQVRYQNSVVLEEHVLRFYLDAQVQFDDEEGLVVGDYAETVHNIVKEIFVRSATWSAQLPTYQILSVEAWNTEEGENAYVGEDIADYSDVTYSGASPNAAAYLTYTFATANKRPYRMTFFDTTNASPQKSDLPQPPTEDDDSLAWYILKSPIGFVNNDNIRLTKAGFNYRGSNRKLVRAYGNQKAS